jgi:hypothetical protein
LSDVWIQHPADESVSLQLGNKGVQQVITDEVQKLPQVLEVVHLIIEENRDLQFVLTGSSARKLPRPG